LGRCLCEPKEWWSTPPGSARTLEIGKLYEYDIILLDLVLPDMDGYEVLRRLRASRIATRGC